MILFQYIFTKKKKKAQLKLTYKWKKIKFPSLRLETKVRGKKVKEERKLDKCDMNCWKLNEINFFYFFWLGFEKCQMKKKEYFNKQTSIEHLDVKFEKYDFKILTICKL